MKFKAKNFKWGEKLGQYCINVATPEKFKKVVTEYCYDQKISVSEYLLNLIAKDLREKDQDFDSYLLQIEREQSHG